MYYNKSNQHDTRYIYIVASKLKNVMFRKTRIGEREMHFTEGELRLTYREMIIQEIDNYSILIFIGCKAKCSHD